jgi:hypothetical protein
MPTMTKLDDWLTALRELYRRNWPNDNPGHWISDEQMSRIMIAVLKENGMKISQDDLGVWHMAEAEMLAVGKRLKSAPKRS